MDVDEYCEGSKLVMGVIAKVMVGWTVANSAAASEELKIKMGWKYWWRLGWVRYQCAKEPVVSSKTIHDVMVEEIIESACICDDVDDSFEEEVVEWNMIGDDVRVWTGGGHDEGGGGGHDNDEVKMGGVAGDVILNFVLDEVAWWKWTGA